MRITASDIRHFKPTCLCGWLLLNYIEIDLMVIAVVVCTLLQISGNMWQASIRSLIQLQLCRWYGFTLLQAKCIKCHYALQAEHKSPPPWTISNLNTLHTSQIGPLPQCIGALTPINPQLNILLYSFQKCEDYDWNWNPTRPITGILDLMSRSWNLLL